MEWKRELLTGIDYTNKDEVREWYEAKERHFGRRVTSQDPCVKRVDLYKVRGGSLPKSGIIDLPECEACKRSVPILVDRRADE